MSNREGLSPKKPRNPTGYQAQKRSKDPVLPRVPFCFFSIKKMESSIKRPRVKNGLRMKKGISFSQMDPRPRVIHTLQIEPPGMPRMLVTMGKTSLFILFN